MSAPRWRWLSRPLLRGGLGALLLALAVVAWANWLVLQRQAQATDALDRLPARKACLVLGTAPTLGNGRPNLYFEHRMVAARQVYAAGKCESLVVSGDNRRHDYNEPEAMKAHLVRLGVPVARIHCDYAGGRTLDSVLRFKQVFGQHQGIVISQAFHNARALYIAQAHGLDLVGFNARDVAADYGLRTQAREVFSRLRAFVDVEVLNSQPRHGGAPVAL